MNWKLILVLSCFGLLMGIASVLGLTKGLEPVLDRNRPNMRDNSGPQALSQTFPKRIHGRLDRRYRRAVDSGSVS